MGGGVVHHLGRKGWGGRSLIKSVARVSHHQMPNFSGSLLESQGLAQSVQT